MRTLFGIILSRSTNKDDGSLRLKVRRIGADGIFLVAIDADHIDDKRSLCPSNTALFFGSYYGDRRFHALKVEVIQPRAKAA